MLVELKVSEACRMEDSKIFVEMKVAKLADLKFSEDLKISVLNWIEVPDELKV